MDKIRNMNFKLPISIAILFSLTMANAQLQIPALSPNSEIKQTVGLTEVTVQYSRPAVRGRAVFDKDGLIPYNELWRTGANAATKFSSNDAITIGGAPLDKGEYALLTKPGKDSWTINFYPYESTNWNDYVSKQPQLSMAVPSKRSGQSIESFEISFRNITLESADLVLAWERTAVSIPIKVEVKDRVLRDIEHVMNGPDPNDYFRAALFLHESGMELEKALSYIQKVTNDTDALFFQVHREALILEDLGKEQEALRAARRSLKLSKKAHNKDFVRLNEKLIKRLVK